MSRPKLIGCFAGLLLLALGAALFIFSQSQRQAVDRLGFIKERVRQQFPTAPQLSTAQLAERLAAGEKIVILDVREENEFAVSHLPGAIRVDPDAAPALPPGLDASLPIVAYCSVGWRSSKWVESLREQGLDAENLEGSIFQWAAEDRALERGGEAVEVVHPYSRAWAWLVDPVDRAYAPP